jgi:hypothetical protein
MYLVFDLLFLKNMKPHDQSSHLMIRSYKLQLLLFFMLLKNQTGKKGDTIERVNDASERGLLLFGWQVNPSLSCPPPLTC